MQSVTLLTCDAAPNGVAAGIHDRMPVILADREVQNAWLDPTFQVAELLDLCGAVPAGRLSARPANPAVNKPGVPEGPSLLDLPA